MWFQSTHPRGVRQKQTVAFFEAMQFQSTHPRGVRPSFNVGGTTTTLKFQSTHPRGVRPAPNGRNSMTVRVSIHAPAWGATNVRSLLAYVSSRFNPRTRVGCDGPGSSVCSTGRTFQSTHPRGVRHGRRDQQAGRQGFQSTHPRGVRPGLSRRGCFGMISFQSTHPRGVRQDAPAHGLHHPVCFNPRTRVGCDLL